jgi:hypothetical protein
MRKRVVLGAMALMLISSAGCSSVPKEKEIKEDLENYSEKKFLSDGEVIDEVKIEDRDTNKKEKYDNVLCTVVTEKNNISYEKEVNLTYQKYEKDWELKDLSVNDSDAWVVKPLKGIAEKDIPSTLVAEKVDVEGETWNIEDGEVKKISIKKQETDLKEKTDKITMEIVLDTGRKDEADLQEAFEKNELRNGCPILINKKRIKGSDVIMREFYTEIPEKIWDKRKNEIADSMNIHYVKKDKPFSHGEKANGRRIVMY